eukprot:6214407-Pleurochrysis_carterae.AAC.1
MHLADLRYFSPIYLRAQDRRAQVTHQVTVATGCWTPSAAPLLLQASECDRASCAPTRPVVQAQDVHSLLNTNLFSHKRFGN